MQLKSGLRFKDGNPVTPAANQAYQWAFGQGPRRAGRSPSHLRPGAAWRLRRPPDRPQAASRPRGSLEPAPHHALHVGGPGPSAAGRGARAPLLWPWPPLAFLALCALPTPICPCSVGRAGEVVDDLCLDLSAPGLLIRWCLSGFRSCQMGLPEPVGAGWGGSGSPPRGPGGCLASLDFACPAPTPPPWAAPFTTSGYRTLHEFRSQWNYFRILVNRKLGVFHKLPITAMWWAEPGSGP